MKKQSIEKHVSTITPLKNSAGFSYKTDSDILNPNNDKKFNRVFNRYMNFYDIHEHICSCDNGFEEICNLKYDLDMFFKTVQSKPQKRTLKI